LIGFTLLILLAIVTIGSSVLLSRRQEPVTPTDTSAATPPSCTVGFTVPGSVVCKVRFIETDRLYCNPSQTPIVAKAIVDSVPSGSTLQKSWNIVEPSSKATKIVYSTEPAVAGKTYDVSATWPGIGSTDKVVEVHFGLNVLDSAGNPLPNCTASLDYYWYPWAAAICKTDPKATSVPGNSREAEGLKTISNSANEDNSIYTANSSIWLGNGSDTSTSYAGLRFINVNVPQGAKITSAKFEVHPIQYAWISLSMDMFAHKTDNSPAFSATSLPSTRSRTTAVVKHSSNVRWNAGTWYDLGDITPLVQEVVNRPGWKNGNSLSIILKGTGTKWGRKFIHGFDNTTLSPRLIVTYTP
jgi:hypothetical protein